MIQKVACERGSEGKEGDTVDKVKARSSLGQRAGSRIDSAAAQATEPSDGNPGAGACSTRNTANSVQKIKGRKVRQQRGNRIGA